MDIASLAWDWAGGAEEALEARELMAGVMVALFALPTLPKAIEAPSIAFEAVPLS